MTGDGSGGAVPALAPPIGQAAAVAGPVVIVMGVSASGKSTVAAALAGRLGVAWRDADDLHPPLNIAKMAAGIPLTDADRRPWLDRVAAELAVGRDAGGIVVACSALRRAYRERLRARCPAALFVHLDGDRLLLAQRASARKDHFMPPALLESQLATLEPLGNGEAGLVVDIEEPAARIVDVAAEWVTARDRADR
jgi:carbohydrate kinase (thermoresistant glucokinase family)